MSRLVADGSEYLDVLGIPIGVTDTGRFPLGRLVNRTPGRVGFRRNADAPDRTRHARGTR